MSSSVKLFNTVLLPLIRGLLLTSRMHRNRLAAALPQTSIAGFKGWSPGKGKDGKGRKGGRKEHGHSQF